MSPAGLVTLYRKFEELTDALVERFQTPIPQAPPFSRTCPPAHEDSQVFVTIRLQNYWGEFCLGLIDASSQGGQETLSGRILAPLYPEASTHETKREVRRIAKEVAATLALPNPVWHSCGFIVNVARRLGLQNFNEIDFSLSPNLTATYATHVRNFVVHPGPDSEPRFLQVAAHYGLPNSSPVDLLRSRQLGGTTLFEFWVRDLQGAARRAIQ